MSEIVPTQDDAIVLTERQQLRREVVDDRSSAGATRIERLRNYQRYAESFPEPLRRGLRLANVWEATWAASLGGGFDANEQRELMALRLEAAKGIRLTPYRVNEFLGISASGSHPLPLRKQYGDMALAAIMASDFAGDRVAAMQRFGPLGAVTTQEGVGIEWLAQNTEWSV